MVRSSISPIVSPLGSEVVCISGPEPGSWTADLDAGYFIGRLKLELIGSRRAIALAPFAFVDSRGLRWELKEGDMLDGSSIPWLLQRWLGGPWEGLHRFASSLHDRGCVEKKRRSELVHLMYYDGCRAAGESKALLLYWGITIGGPRFPGRPAVV
jgi:hypothetical protein